MEKITDWLALWRELVEVRRKAMTSSPGGSAKDPWRDKAREFDSRSGRRWSDTDPLRDFVSSQVDSNVTVLDIGAGTGRWAAFLARRAKRITAVEPSPAMTTVLEEKLVEEGIENVSVIEGYWPAVDVETHDVALASHSVYFSPDLEGFISKMVAVTRRTCYLLLRAALTDGLMAEAALRVWGQPHDSPNFAVAYNVLLQMGLRPNVLWDDNPWRPWTSPSMEAALADVKQRLLIESDHQYDHYLRDLLERRLTLSDGQYVWPPSVRTVLVYWNV